MGLSCPQSTLNPNSHGLSFGLKPTGGGLSGPPLILCDLTIDYHKLNAWMLSNYLETYYIPLCLYVAAAAAAAAATTAAAATAAAATIKNGKETSFLYKKLYLGHLNMNITYWCTYVVHIDVKVLLLLLLLQLQHQFHMVIQEMIRNKFFCDIILIKSKSKLS